VLSAPTEVDLIGANAFDIALLSFLKGAPINNCRRGRGSELNEPAQCLRFEFKSVFASAIARNSLIVLAVDKFWVSGVFRLTVTHDPLCMRIHADNVQA
jgi:hypothetical protein